MKKQLTLAIAALGILIALPACTTVEDAPATHTSSTTETSVRHPSTSTTVETTSVRRY